jgi:hypothetical protein
MQLSQLDHPWTFCVLCIDEALPRTPTDDRRALARSVALVARRNAAVPEDEVRAALLGAAFRPPVLRLATAQRRRAVRQRLARIGRLGRTSLPNLASELEAIGAESLPEEAANDDIWEEVCRYLLADVARPELN